MFNFLFVSQCLRRLDLSQRASCRLESLDPYSWRKASNWVKPSSGEIRWTGHVPRTHFHITPRDALALELPQWRAWEAWWDHQTRHGNLERRVQICSIEWPPAAWKLCLAFDHGEEKTGYLTLENFSHCTMNSNLVSNMSFGGNQGFYTQWQWGCLGEAQACGSGFGTWVCCVIPWWNWSQEVCSRSQESHWKDCKGRISTAYIKLMARNWSCHYTIDIHSPWSPL